MRYKIVTSTAAILSFVNGFLFLLAPVFSLSLLGRDTNPTGIMNTRYFGASALGLAVIMWLARNIQFPEVRRLVSYGMLTTLAILVVIDLNGLITGAMNQLGWLLFLIDLILSLGFILSIFTDGGQKI
jgi:uncharacterized membrane protein